MIKSAHTSQLTESIYGLEVSFVMPSSSAYVMANIPFYNRAEVLANNAGSNTDPNSTQHDQSPASAYVAAIAKAIMNLTKIYTPEIIIKAMIITADKTNANTSTVIGAYGQAWNPFDGYGIPRVAESVAYINNTLRVELIDNSIRALYTRNVVPDYFDYESLPDHVAPSKAMLKDFNKGVWLAQIEIELLSSSGRMWVRVDNNILTIGVFNLKLNTPLRQGSSLYSISEQIPKHYANWSLSPIMVIASNEGKAFAVQFVERRLTFSRNPIRTLNELSEHEFSATLSVPLK